MNNDHIHFGSGDSFEIILALPFVMVLIIYILAAVLSSRRHKRWPLYRTAYWIFGVLAAVSAVVGPLANQSHIDFSVHMLGHLLFGMLAPLLIVLAAPMTLILRTFNVKTARRLSCKLKSWPVRSLSDDPFASHNTKRDL